MTLSLIIIIVTVLISLASFQNRALMDQLKFHPWTMKRENQWHRFFSYGFVHADYMHLFVNMWVLYIFGDNVEAYLRFFYDKNAIPIFVALYFGGLIFSTIYSYVKHRDNVLYSAVGASGAVSSLVFASIVVFPTDSLMIFPLPFQIPAYLFGVLYLIYSFTMARRAKDNIGHDAHFFGAIFGIIFMAILDFNLITRFLSMV
ncbi:MAG: rhomboid family intramembrane serine protease [Bacteroidales bacterium]|nr:rhomboid family intramembrane serine protease [Bacteroidales bacterium]